MPPGRWPANVILDPDSAALLDAMSGERKSGKPLGRMHTDPGRMVASGASEGGSYFHTGYGDTGGASRFFLVAPIDDPDAEHLRFKYEAKASRSERNAGLDGMPERAPAFGNEKGDGLGRGISNTRQDWTRANHHPTVKPLSLMRWLVRLVTPPGGVILDPFTGSGSTGCAAALEGFDFIGCEREAEYVEIARARVAYWTPEPQPQLALSLEMTA
jgi:site-specific DNA-methyltransferase (adenine-specific)